MPTQIELPPCLDEALHELYPTVQGARVRFFLDFPFGLNVTNQPANTLSVGFRRRSFDRAAAAVGLPWLTPHMLRHTAASLAVSVGANVKAVQQMLGHASAAMTLDVYAGLFGDDFGCRC